jgi:hypothetical protein
MHVIKKTRFFTAALSPDAELYERGVGQSEERTEPARNDLEGYISMSKIQVTAKLDNLVPRREFKRIIHTDQVTAVFLSWRRPASITALEGGKVRPTVEISRKSNSRT